MVDHPTRQLRGLISDWVMRKYRYKTTVLHMWTNQTTPHGLDHKASNSINGKGVGNGVNRVNQILDLVTGELLAKGGTHRDSTGTVMCPLCGKGPDNWSDMLLACEHDDVKEYYTARHNAAGQRLMRYMKDGKMERWLMPTNFGRLDGYPEEATVPDWMLGEEGRKKVLMRARGDRGIKTKSATLRAADKQTEMGRVECQQTSTRHHSGSRGDSPGEERRGTEVVGYCRG